MDYKSVNHFFACYFRSYLANWVILIGAVPPHVDLKSKESVYQKLNPEMIDFNAFL